MATSKILVHRSKSAFTSTGEVFRAHRSDGTSLFLSEPTRDALVREIRKRFPEAAILDVLQVKASR